MAEEAVFLHACSLEIPDKRNPSWIQSNCPHNAVNSQCSENIKSNEFKPFESVNEDDLPIHEGVTRD